MNVYTLKGSYKKAGAIGVPSPFEIEWKAETPLIAMNEARESLYNIGWDHILFREVWIEDEEIPMMQALELE